MFALENLILILPGKEVTSNAELAVVLTISSCWQPCVCAVSPAGSWWSSVFLGF
jgi:hypothetical protein